MIWEKRFWIRAGEVVGLFAYQLVVMFGLPAVALVMGGLSVHSVFFLPEGQRYFTTPEFVNLWFGTGTAEWPFLLYIELPAVLVLAIVWELSRRFIFQNSLRWMDGDYEGEYV